jgi:hypothetical protein
LELDPLQSFSKKGCAKVDIDDHGTPVDVLDKAVGRILEEN